MYCFGIHQPLFEEMEKPSTNSRQTDVTDWSCWTIWCTESYRTWTWNCYLPRDVTTADWASCSLHRTCSPVERNREPSH
jgi:hypothetical protein